MVKCVLSLFPTTKENMETIRVHDEEIQIGTITCAINDTEVVAYASGKAIRQWMPVIHEVRGRGVFKDEIIHIKDSGSKVKFIFAFQTTDVDAMRTAVKQLIAQAAMLYHERERLRSQADHPSSGVTSSEISDRSLVVITNDRYHRSPRWMNVPPGLRRRR